MKTARKIVFTVMVMALVAGTAQADWDIGDPAIWVQRPDLSATGLDVLGSYPDPFVVGVGDVGMQLADDWRSSGGPLTDIHIWGSWLNDILPLNSFGGADPGAVIFKLRIRTDIPADSAIAGTTADRGKNYGRPSSAPKILATGLRVCIRVVFPSSSTTPTPTR